MERPGVYGWCDTDWTDTLDSPTSSEGPANDGAASSVSSWYDLDRDRPEDFETVPEAALQTRVDGGFDTGGLVGENSGTISSSYATGRVGGYINVGGLVGTNWGTISSSYFDRETTGQAYGVGTGNAGGATGFSSEEMKKSNNFSGWSISSVGSSSSTWRIYEGSTAPLLRTFLTPLATDTSTTYQGAVQFGAGYGLSNVFGTVAAGKNVGTYTGGKLYSNQQGYDLSGTGTLTITKADAVVTANSNMALTYNGANQTVSGFTASGLQGGETASVLSGVTASTTYKNAGTYRTTATGSDGNYNLSFVSGSMAIDKAALSYTANKASFNTGNTLAPLSGTVSGFVNGEAQDTATTGTLAWTTPATSASGAGSYAINGSGLLADNYSFSQALGNGSALTLTQSASVAPFVPVVTTPPLPSDTSFVKPAPLAQTSPPFSGLADINTLPATAAGSVQSNSLNVIKAFGSSGVLYAQVNSVRMPATYYQSNLVDPAQNP
jgi:hypothetical protein